jgi:hypothetical protein
MAESFPFTANPADEIYNYKELQHWWAPIILITTMITDSLK